MIFLQKGHLDIMFLSIKHGSPLVDKLMIKTVEHGMLKTHTHCMSMISPR